MATHIIGQRQPKRLGLPTGNKPLPAVPQGIVAGVYMVVSKGFAGRMQGWQSNKAANGTLYACFNNKGAAVQYIKNNNMRLYASIVQG